MRSRLAFVLVGVAVLSAVAGAWAYRELGRPYGEFREEPVFVEFPPGIGAAGVASRLADAGVVSHPLIFRLAARLAGAERRLQAGEYQFSAPATPAEVVARLARGDVYRRSLTVPEGLTIREMARLVEQQGFDTAEAFRHAAADSSPIAELVPGARTLEGYLFPDTYALPRRTDAAAIVRRMVAGFERAFDPSLRGQAAARGLSVEAVVTLASLIEKETARPEERAVVSAVYRNRLARRMPLQCDPTVIYALMLAGRWDGNIRKADLLIDSPYNTYRYPGLPPGPIASPGRASIVAALQPADVPYLYFVSRNDGSHVFAATLEEHNRNVRRWQIRRR